MLENSSEWVLCGANEPFVHVQSFGSLLEVMRRLFNPFQRFEFKPIPFKLRQRSRRFVTYRKMDRGLVELDVGGKVFRTTMSTLCSVDGYFARMLQNGNWSDGKDGTPIFIDRGNDVVGSFCFYK